MRLSGRIQNLKPTAVNSILAEVRELQAGGADLVSLMRGEPDLPTPPHIVEAAGRALSAGRTAYPDNRGEPKLREAVAAKLVRENGLSYDPGTEILVTTGATFGIYAALAAILDAGDEVILPDPVYDAYLSPVRLAGGVRSGSIGYRKWPLHAVARGAGGGLDAQVAGVGPEHSLESHGDGVHAGGDRIDCGVRRRAGPVGDRRRDLRGDRVR